LVFCRKPQQCQREGLLAKVVEDIMNLLNRTLAAALIAGGVSSLAGSAHAVPLAASLSLRDASTSDVQTVQWRRWGWGGSGVGLAAGAIFGAALSAPYYGYGYPAYSYGYGYPAYSYGYSYPGYGYGYPAYSYGYSYPAYSYGYAPAYSYSYYPRYRYRAAFYRPWRGW
jgi:hypothetical protein